jgi:hypothetical protein
LVKKGRSVDVLWFRALGALALLALAAVLLTANPAPPSAAQANGHSLRFYGNGVAAPDLDRVKIPLGNPSRPVNVSGNFTLEFWMKTANVADNTGVAGCGNNDGWITGNIIFDRDIFSELENGDYGIALHRSGTTRRIAFGASTSASGGGTTLCGSINVADGNWHHVAVTRNSGTGQMRLFVDGVQDTEASGPTGDISYAVGRSTSYPNSDPYLVIGAEKHDAGSGFPSYNGFVDEIRLSNSIRYSGNFTRPSAPFVTDANTVALYHLDDGPAGNCTTGTTITDSSGFSGGPSNGECRFGGGTNDGPVWSTDTPFSASSTPTPTPTRTPTRTPTITPTPVDCNIAQCVHLPLIQR